MPVTVQSLINVTVAANEKLVSGLGAAAEKVHRFEYAKQLGSGTSASQQDRAWSEEDTNITTAVTRDLAASLSSALQATITWVEITFMFLKVRTTTSGRTLNVGGGSNPFINWVAAANDELILGPDSLFALGNPVDGYGVTAGTGDVLELTPSASLNFDLLIMGRSA